MTGGPNVRARDRVFGRESLQGGAATLIMVLAVLVLLTVVTVMTAQVAVVEQRTAANELRGRQAFEAAMTGYERALVCAGNPATELGGAVLCPPPGPAAPARAPSGGTYAVEFCNTTLFNPAPVTDPTEACPPAAGAGRRLIYARGWSDDRTGVHHVMGLVKSVPSLAGMPNVPLTARGVAASQGAMNVRNPCGRSTIWSGQEFDPGPNSQFKTTILAPDGSGFIESSNKNQEGMDVVASDGSLSRLTGDRFFENFMGLPPAAYLAGVGPTLVSDLGDYEGAKSYNKVFWLPDPDRTDGALPEFGIQGGDFGTLGEEGLDPCRVNPSTDNPPQPTVIVVEGNLRITGNPVINGLLYVKGDVFGAGTALVNGAVIIEGSIQMNGTLDVVYSPLALTRAAQLGRSAGIPGSWKDWL